MFHNAPNESRRPKGTKARGMSDCGANSALDIEDAMSTGIVAHAQPLSAARVNDVRCSS